MPPKPLPDDPDLLPAPVDTGEDVILGAKKKRPTADSTFTPPPPLANTSADSGLMPPPPTPTASFNTPTSNIGSSFGGVGTSNSGFGGSSGFNSGSSYSSSSSFSSNTAPSAPMNEHEYNMAKARLDLEKERMDESWIKQYWRPAMGWLYMAICFADFIFFPALTIFLPVIFKPFGIVVPYVPWKSLTLENGGLVHMAFGAILGVAAWTRGQEKIQGKA